MAPPPPRPTVPPPRAPVPSKPAEPSKQEPPPPPPPPPPTGSAHVKMAEPSPKPSQRNTNQTVIEVSRQSLPEVEINSTSTSCPGYIRVRGTLQTIHSHTYEGLLPTQDILHATSTQQTNLINAMVAAQQGSSTPRSSLSSSHHRQRTLAPAKTIAPTLTAANLERASSASSSGLTSVSRRPAKTMAGAAATAITAKTSGVPKLRCCNCGVSKREGVANVRVVAGGVPICWECRVRVEGSEGVREWLAGT